MYLRLRYEIIFFGVKRGLRVLASDDFTLVVFEQTPPNSRLRNARSTDNDTTSRDSHANGNGGDRFISLTTADFRHERFVRSVSTRSVDFTACSRFFRSRHTERPQPAPSTPLVPAQTRSRRANRSDHRRRVLTGRPWKTLPGRTAYEGPTISARSALFPSARLVPRTSFERSLRPGPDTRFRTRPVASNADAGRVRACPGPGPSDAVFSRSRPARAMTLRDARRL